MTTAARPAPTESKPARVPLSTSESASFRDPGGFVVVTPGRVFRVVNDESHAEVNEFLESDVCSQLVSEGLLIKSWHVQHDSLGNLGGFAKRSEPHEHTERMVLEHERVAFPSYPYEWPPEMLYAAGELTLDLMERLLPRQYGLKDATPYNLLYRGNQPVFVDLLSIERRNPADPTWRPFAQFVRTFIRPLIVNKHFGVGLDQVFRVHRDGIYPEELFQMCGFWQKLRPPFLTLVSVPALLSRLHPVRYQKAYQPRQTRSAEQARFILRRQLKGLRRKLESVKPDPRRKSIWADYPNQGHQGEDYRSVKQRLVDEWIARKPPTSVLDVGCNVGYFSRLAASLGASVVAIDRDPVVVGKLWREAAVAKQEILPLVIDLTRPTPGLGWRNQESQGFLDRATGAFECVLMLAVIHHMMVTERIPLPEILKLASELTRDLLIIEYIEPQDQMFRLITRGNQHLYESQTRENFEDVSRNYFRIEKTERIGDSQRWLYLMRSARVA